MSTLYRRTPVIESSSLSTELKATCWLKLECLQPSGSFKNRGMGEAARQAVEGGADKLVCSSGGNAGLAVAFAGRQLRVPVTIVVPESTGQRPRDLIQAEGAMVKVHGTAWDDAHQFALGLCEETSAAYLHPFDDPVVWEGHATLVDEIVEDGVVPELVVVAVGGGGLFCGLMLGLDRHGLGDVKILAVETEGAASLHRSVLAGSLVELDRIDSIATTLGARKVTQRALDYARRETVTTCTVSDRQALDACLSFADDHRLLVEPACGAALAAVQDGQIPIENPQNMLVIVCGGAGVTIQLLEEWNRLV